jgi:hypothetical protein
VKVDVQPHSLAEALHGDDGTGARVVDAAGLATLLQELRDRADHDPALGAAELRS